MWLPHVQYHNWFQCGRGRVSGGVSWLAASLHLTACPLYKPRTLRCRTTWRECVRKNYSVGTLTLPSVVYVDRPPSPIGVLVPTRYCVDDRSCELSSTLPREWTPSRFMSNTWFWGYQDNVHHSSWKGWQLQFHGRRWYNKEIATLPAMCRTSRFICTFSVCA